MRAKELEAVAEQVSIAEACKLVHRWRITIQKAQKEIFEVRSGMSGNRTILVCVRTSARFAKLGNEDFSSFREFALWVAVQRSQALAFACDKGMARLEV